MIMKNRFALATSVLATIAGLTLVPTTLHAQGDLVVDNFATPVTVDLWGPTWGTAPVLSFDSQDARGLATSGSLRVAADYFTPEDNGWEQMVITKTFEAPVVGAEYASVSVDVKVDPSSTPTAAGQYGYFELKRPDGAAIGGVNLAGTNWTTIKFNLAPTEGTLTGIIIQNGNGGFRGPIIYHLDNFVFTRRAAQVAPPTLAIEKNLSPGLKLYASAPGQAYQRQNIVYAPSEDLANALWWVNQPEPITYSVTWSDFPDKDTSRGFQGHLMLAADTGGAITPDWNDPNVIMLEFQYVNTAGPDGTAGTADDQVLAQARFLHKVNEAAQNAMLYRGPNTNGQPAGVLGGIRAPSMLGTWSVAFKGNQDITLTAPDGSTANLVMPPEDAPLYEPTTKGVSALVGVQPNADTRIGQSATISRIKITKGAKVVVDDAFQTSELDPAKWTVRAQDPGGILTISPDVAHLISWGLPDTGFSLRASPTVTGPWSALGTPLLVGARRVVLIGKVALPGLNAGFFRLAK
jgi:hypothetical protein